MPCPTAAASTRLRCCMHAITLGPPLTCHRLFKLSLTGCHMLPAGWHAVWCSGLGLADSTTMAYHHWATVALIVVSYLLNMHLPGGDGPVGGSP